MSAEMPPPSDRALALVGQQAKYRENNGELIDVTVTGARKVFSVITKADGSTWTSVQYRLKPSDGRRAFWTCSMPDELVEGGAA